ncbi:MAG: aminotransferase class V-fold PLP-dependent enzyme [Chloroflexi bacterium]|nr:aminotransferase class V-fold PLP-dependent enzyme [Chloroflexota bacterium]
MNADERGFFVFYPRLSAFIRVPFENVDMDIQSLRAAIPALQHSTYLNTGTFGPLPRAVSDELAAGYVLVAEHGAFSPVVRQQIERDGYERARARVAALLNVSSDELALTRSSSDGICIVAYGLDWKPGDEVVISDQEHPSGEMPWFVLHKRYGVNVRVARVAPEPSETLRNFADAITPRTRLVFASHVCCTTGERLPVKDICALAHARNVLAAIDGSHAVGQFGVDLQKFKPDFYVTCGHKWLLGPQGTAMLFVARRHLDTLQPSWIGWGAQRECSEDLDALAYEPLDSARRYEFGTKPWPLYLGLDRAIWFIQEIGLDAIEQRVAGLAEQFKTRVAEMSGVTLLTPMAAARSCGLVSVRVPDFAGADLRDFFWNCERILVSSNEVQKRVRFSLAFFTTESELASALDALRLSANSR